MDVLIALTVGVIVGAAVTAYVAKKQRDRDVDESCVTVRANILYDVGRAVDEAVNTLVRETAIERPPLDAMVRTPFVARKLFPEGQMAAKR